MLSSVTARAGLVVPRVPPGLGVSLLAVAAIAPAGAASGGYFATTWGWISLGLLLVVATALVFRPAVQLARVEVAFLGAVALLTAWVALSAAWSDSLPASVLETQRVLIYLAAVAALFCLGGRERLSAVLGGVLVAIVVLAVWALAGRVDGGDGPLSGPLGYWNALGILAAIGILLAAGFVVAPGPSWRRAAAAAALLPLSLALALTSSRGALAAFIGAGAVGVAVHPALDGRRRIVCAAAAGILLVAAGPALVRAGGPAQLADDVRDAVAAPVAARGEQEESLLSVSANGRVDYWRVAWHQAREHPWLGSGAGTFEVYWNRDRDTVYGTRDAHSLYLETLAELGPFGLLLLGVALAVPLVAFARVRRSPLAAGALAGYVAFLVHAGIDWDWELPAVTLPVLLLAAAAVTRPEPEIQAR
jgi:O-antigen ligase